MSDDFDALPVLRPSDPGPRVPRRGSRLSSALGSLILRLVGWRITGELPDEPRAVVIGAPHTSNFDGLVGISALQALRLDVRFMAKHSLFRGPPGRLLKALGGIPVNRRNAGGVVHGARALLKGGDPFWLGITPEGTRTGASEWKTGFYRIAADLGVPIIVVTFCYRKKEVQVLGALRPGGDPAADLEAIYAKLDHVTPRHPERLSAPLRRRRQG